MLPRLKCESGLTLVELVVVGAILAILATIALPTLGRARVSVLEASVVADLRAMAADQEIFYTNPVPISPLTADSPRYARLDELNSFASGAYGETLTTNSLRKDFVVYSMPLLPEPKNRGQEQSQGKGKSAKKSTITAEAALETEYLIQATGSFRGVTFAYEVDETRTVAKIR